MKEAYSINENSGECTLTKMSKEPDKIPNAQGSWGIGSYSTRGDGNADGYGFMRPENPNNFWPDYECCEPWEIENHKLACKEFNQKQPATAEKEGSMQPTTEQTTKTYGSGQTAPDYDHTAKVAHEVNRAFCESIGDNSQPAWEDAPEWQKSSARNGVKAHIESGLTLTPEQSHESWMAQKTEEGWIFGEVKDPEHKTHPCMVPYNQLPIQQRTKDYLFRAVVHAIHG